MFSVVANFWRIAVRIAVIRDQVRMRRDELWAGFVVPSASSRATAFELLHDYLQQAIEETRITLAWYAEIRRQLLYVPPDLLIDLVAALQNLLASDEARRIDGVQRQGLSVPASIGTGTC